VSNLLNTTQAAEKLGVSVRRVQALIKKGQLKAERVGRDYLIREKDLQSIKAGKVGRPRKISK
jgi:excisionase family DNA binding protein